jgi:hypothetical protein
MPLLKALSCQFLALAITFLVATKLPIFHHPIVFLLSQSTLAVGSSMLIRQPTWWILIHLVFLPLVFIFFTLTIPAWFYLVIVALMTLIFWGTIRGDVPLFLSSNEVADAVSLFVELENAKNFADLGAGVGTVAVHVAKELPNLKVEAWERAPLPFLMSFWRGRKLQNYNALRENFFNANFADYEVIFAFLSPAAMPEVSAKIQREMKPGTLFISSSFPSDLWHAESVLHLNDFRKTVLYCYRIA